MKKFDRAVRRHHRFRLRENRKNYHLGAEFYSDPDGVKSFWVNTPTPCSCWGCGNPRKYENGPRLTIQECRFNCVEIEYVSGFSID
jgi:hypothetical protein